MRSWKGHDLKWRSRSHVFLGRFSITLIREQVLMLIASTLHLSICAWSITTSYTPSRRRLWNYHRILMTITTLSPISSRIRFCFFVPSWCNQHCCTCLLNVWIFLSCPRFSVTLHLICIIGPFLDTTRRFAFSWRFLWFRVERDDLMNLFQNLNHSTHIMAFLYVQCFHLLDVLRYGHIGTFENVDCKVQILQSQLFCQGFVIHKLLDFLLIWRGTHDKSN